MPVKTVTPLALVSVPETPPVKAPLPVILYRMRLNRHVWFQCPFMKPWWHGHIKNWIRPAALDFKTAAWTSVKTKEQVVAQTA